MIDVLTRALVRSRADFQCEYCKIHEPRAAFPSFHIEHVIARQHGGGDDDSNLALACDRCNLYKGPNLTAIDPVSGNLVVIFNPRRDAWNEHFELDEGIVIGLTAIGRATARLLNMNAQQRISRRRLPPSK